MNEHYNEEQGYYDDPELDELLPDFEDYFIDDLDNIREIDIRELLDE